MKQRRMTTHLRCVSLRKAPLAVIALAFFFLVGVFLGWRVSARSAETMGAELRRYVESYLALHADGAVSADMALKTLVCFFRASVLAFLLGFASIGVVLIPALCAAQGFFFSFALFSFASGLGMDGFFFLLPLFGMRFLVVLPCTLLLGAAALETSRALAALSFGSGKRAKSVVYGRPYWSRFGIVCLCLFFGTALELWLVPHFLALLS